MDESKLRLIPAARDPALHSTSVAVNAIPHDLRDESTYVQEAGDSVELRHPYGRLITTGFTHHCCTGRPEVRLPATRANARILLHPLNQNLEVAAWEFQMYWQSMAGERLPDSAPKLNLGQFLVGASSWPALVPQEWIPLANTVGCRRLMKGIILRL